MVAHTAALACMLPPARPLLQDRFERTMQWLAAFEAHALARGCCRDDRITSDPFHVGCIVPWTQSVLYKRRVKHKEAAAARALVDLHMWQMDDSDSG